MRRFALLLALGSCAFAQAQFDIASIKPTAAAETSTSGIYSGHGKIDAHNVTLKTCILGAYAVTSSQVVGGPDWLGSDRFDILAKTDPSVNSDAVLMRMFQALLAERFRLAVHRETRPLQAYVIEVGKNGPKIEKTKGGGSSTDGEHGTLVAVNTTMDTFALVIAGQVELPVVNKTGLEGGYDLKLKWTPERELSRPDAGPPIFTAIQEQLGLRLRAQKVLLEVVVIDRPEKPTAN